MWHILAERVKVEKLSADFPSLSISWLHKQHLLDLAAFDTLRRDFDFQGDLCVEVGLLTRINPFVKYESKNRAH